MHRLLQLQQSVPRTPWVAVVKREGLEADCTRPGSWRVEGYDVERRRADGKVWWQVFERWTALTGEAPSPVEVFHGKRRTFAGACDLIRDLQDNRTHGR